MRTLLFVSLGSILPLMGCTPDSMGAGSDGSTSRASEDGATQEDGTSGGPMTATENGTDGATSAATADSSGDPGCTDPDTMVLWAADGELEGLMGLGVSNELGGIEVARSWAAESGTLTLRFELACGGPLYVWGLVYDRVGGTEENADSLYVRVDDDSETVWAYGCNTPAGVEFLWQWTAVDVWDGPACERTPLMLDLPAGMHSIRIRNREDGVDANVAATAAVVVSHDPVTDPLQFLDPDAVGE